MEADRALEHPPSDLGLPADSAVGPLHPDLALEASEELVARRTDARLIRAEEGGLSTSVVDGSLLLTNRRLIHIGTLLYPIDLDEIAELTLAGERLLVSLKDGGGLALEVSFPEDLRAAIAVQIKLAQTPS